MKHNDKQKEGLIYETICVFLVIAMLLCTTSAIAEETTGKGQKTWEGETVEHKGFKDLGNYVIELPDFDGKRQMVGVYTDNRIYW